MAKKILKTSWGGVADWYDELVRSAGSYQKEVILPNVLRLINIRKGTAVADIACGQGFFANEFFRAGASVTGVDISPELIALAKKRSPRAIRYICAPADNIAEIPPSSADVAVCILALQNIENAAGFFKEAARILNSSGRLVIVLNHPAFRIPAESSWGWDDEQKIQYRRIDSYLSESRQRIEMHPGSDPGAVTVSFHRPLQFYAKALAKQGFVITRLEEWNSHKKSQPGPRATAEDRARKEIPLFLAVEAVKSASEGK